MFVFDKKKTNNKQTFSCLSFGGICREIYSLIVMYCLSNTKNRLELVSVLVFFFKYTVSFSGNKFNFFNNKKQYSLKKENQRRHFYLSINKYEPEINKNTHTLFLLYRQSGRACLFGSSSEALQKSKEY